LTRDSGQFQQFFVSKSSKAILRQAKKLEKLVSQPVRLKQQAGGEDVAAEVRGRDRSGFPFDELSDVVPCSFRRRKVPATPSGLGDVPVSP
jgi:hypothetical protein